MADLNFLEAPPPAPQRVRLSPGSLFLVFCVVLAAVVFAVQLSHQNQVQPRTGDIAPDFELTTFDGTTLRLSDLRDSVVLVNFWGSWCPPCHGEAPDLQALYEAYSARGFVVLGINWLDTPRDARAFVDRYGITYINGEDTRERIAKAYHIQGAPENFLVGRDGRIVAAWLSPVTYDMVATELDRLLGNASG
jgi:cytochrome c biogenesis protein CcmG/thiol:disulfide interchange protein DsbE